MEQIDSILTSVKKALGIGEEYEHFDPEIIMHINSIFSILHQIGVGPEEVYRISGKENTWDEFIESKSKLNSVQTYMYLKVRMLFDPPTSSFVLDAMKEQMSEIEWRLNAADDPEFQK